MLKTSSTKSGEPTKGGIRFGSGSKARRDESEVEDDEVGKKVQKTSKSKKSSKSKETLGSDFFTLGAKLVFTKLRQVFLKTPILHYIDPKHHILIKTDKLSYAISGVFSQLTLDDLNQ